MISDRSGVHLFGRNYDRDHDWGEKIIITPRGYPFRFRDGTGSDEHFAMIGTGTIGNGYPIYYEAVNEAGLCIAAVGFRQHAYASPRITEGYRNIPSFDLIPEVLAHCRDLTEAEVFLKEVRIYSTPFSNKIQIPPVRWMLSDSSGTLVAEPVESGLRMVKNPSGVLTDGPPVDQLMSGLNAYINLSRKTPKNLLPDDLRTIHYEKGSGALGLPGDYSPSSRFTRGCFVKYNTAPESDRESCISRMFHILSAVSIPKGCVEISNGVSEYTRYSCCIDPTNMSYYYRCYENSQICCISARRSKLDSNELIVFGQIGVEQILMQNRGGPLVGTRV